LPAKKPSYFLDAPDPTYAMTVSDTPDADSKKVRFRYESLVSPETVFEVDVLTKERTMIKQQPVPGYDPSKYTSEYLHATASDGTSIPISISYKKDTPRDGTAPLLLYGYGSYGYSMEADLDQTMVSLLDRGFVYAIAHIRGGEEMGRHWYEDGKLMKKMNTFTDFIAAAEHLVAERFTTPDRLVIEGGSAGGLLMGAVANMRPDLFKAVVSKVPFVDVINTMSDASLPLTAGEWEEWGNPADPEDYATIRRYDPYMNLAAQRYPAMLVKTAFNDSQVMYWEPAKYVARLRTLKTDSNVLILKTNMAAGHGGASGRYDFLREVAFDYAFILSQVGITR
jgi:oligopeptidase B